MDATLRAPDTCREVVGERRGTCDGVEPAGNPVGTACIPAEAQLGGSWLASKGWRGQCSAKHWLMPLDLWGSEQGTSRLGRLICQSRLLGGSKAERVGATAWYRTLGHALCAVCTVSLYHCIVIAR